MLWLPNRGVRTPHYIPPAVELPHGDVYAIVFDFPATGSLGTADQSEAVHRPFLVTHLAGRSSAVAGSCQVQVFHQHGQEQRQWFPKPILLELVAGAGQSPLVLRSPYYVEAGDSLTVAISNTGQDGGGAYVAADIQLVLWGVQL